MSVGRRPFSCVNVSCPRSGRCGHASLESTDIWSQMDGVESSHFGRPRCCREHWERVQADHAELRIERRNLVATPLPFYCYRPSFPPPPFQPRLNPRLARPPHRALEDAHPPARYSMVIPVGRVRWAGGRRAEQSGSRERLAHRLCRRRQRAPPEVRRRKRAAGSLGHCRARNNDQNSS